MATITSTINVTGLGSSLSASKVQTDGSALVVDESIAAGASDLPVPNFNGIDVSAMSMVALLADGPSGADLTIKTNSSSTPSDTIVLTAGEILLWTGGSGNPFSTDVTTGVFVTNASGTDAATLRCRLLQDATP